MAQTVFQQWIKVCADQSIQDGRECTVTRESEDTTVMMEAPLCLHSQQVLETLSRQELSSLARDSVVLTMSDVRNWGPLTLCECEHRHSKHCRKLSTSLEKGARKVLGLSATTKVKCLLGFFVPRCEAWTKTGAADSRTAIVTARWSTLIRNLDRALRGPQGCLCCLSWGGLEFY